MHAERACWRSTCTSIRFGRLCRPMQQGDALSRCAWVTSPCPISPPTAPRIPLGFCRHSKPVRNALLTPHNRKHTAEQHRHLRAPCCSHPQLGRQSEERGVHNEKHLLPQLSIVFCLGAGEAWSFFLTSEMTAENPDEKQGVLRSEQPGCSAWRSGTPESPKGSLSGAVLPQEAALCPASESAFSSRWTKDVGTLTWAEQRSIFPYLSCCSDHLDVC